MIRLLTEKDINQYLKIRLQSLKTDPKAFLSTFESESKLPLEYFQHKIRNATKDPIFGYYGIINESRLIACAQISESSLDKKRHIAYFYELYVIPEFRRKGYATRLINYLIEKIRSQKEVGQIELRVNSGNISAITLYEKLGFKKIATLPHSVKEPDGSYQDEYFYCLSLNNAKLELLNGQG